jgi:predicted ester cyclase
VREFLESTWRAMPDLAFELLDGPFLHPAEPQAAFHWRGTGTFTGPLEPPGFAPTGTRVDFTGFDRHVYRDGRVSRLWITFDMMDLTRQIGLMPKPGSRFERAGAAAQRAGMRIRDRVRA